MPNRPSAPLRARPGRPCSPLLHIQAIGVVGGEAAAQEDLVVGAAQHLVMGGHDIEAAARIDAELHRGRSLHVAGHELLDDAAHSAKLLQVEVPLHAGGLEGHGGQPSAVSTAERRTGGGAAQVEHRIAFA